MTWWPAMMIVITMKMGKHIKFLYFSYKTPCLCMRTKCMQIFRMPISTFNACLTLTNNAMIQYKFVLTAYHYFELESNSLMNWVASCPTNPIIGGREREVRLHYGPLHTVHHCALLGCTTVHYWPSRSGQPWIWCNLAISNLVLLWYSFLLSYTI